MPLIPHHRDLASGVSATSWLLVPRWCLFLNLALRWTLVTTSALPRDYVLLAPILCRAGTLSANSGPGASKRRRNWNLLLGLWSLVLLPLGNAGGLLDAFFHPDVLERELGRQE